MPGSFFERIERIGRIFEHYKQAGDSDLPRLGIEDDFRAELEALLLDAAGLESRRGTNLEALQAGEDERHRIARELHDGPAQDIAAILAWIRILEETVRDVPQAASEIGEIRKVAKSALEGIRTTLLNLRPPALEDLGLEAAVTAHLDRLKALRPFEIRVSFEPGIARSLSRTDEIQVFRVLQEASSNAVRHGRPARVEVRAGRAPEGRYFEVQDDGAGMGKVSEEALSQAGRHGLKSMKERSEAIGGTLTFIPGEGGGTLVRLLIPA